MIPMHPDIVWLYSSFGLLKFNTRTFANTSFFPHEQEHATRMAIMDGETIWMTNYGVGLYAFDLISNDSPVSLRLRSSESAGLSISSQPHRIG